jgi:sugar lactone lactonase YvrE
LIQLLTLKREPTPRERVLGDVWPAGEGQVLDHRWSAGDGTLDFEDVAEVLRLATGLRKTSDIGPIVLDIAGSGPTFRQNPTDDPYKSGDGGVDDVYLYDPWDLAVAPTGEIYFTEYVANRVRALDTQGKIRTLAGYAKEGFQDGHGVVARFRHPIGIARLPDGSLAVADTLNHAIRRVTLGGDVTTLAGTGKRGFKDGPGVEAQFNEPNGIAADPQGNLYVADELNNRIRKITPDGFVSTLAGEGGKGFEDGPGPDARLFWPTGVTYDPRDGSLFIADMNNHAIRKLTPTGELVTLAGNGVKGTSDGYGSQAQFRIPYGTDLDSEGRLWIADWGNETIRVMQPDGRVETFAGSKPAGHIEGPAPFAKFDGLMNVRVGQNGILFVTSTDNERIQAVFP